VDSDSKLKYNLQESDQWCAKMTKFEEGLNIAELSKLSVGGTIIIKQENSYNKTNKMH